MARQGLGTSSAFRPSCAEVKDSLTVTPQPSFYECIYRIDFHALRAPTEKTIGRWVASADNVDPKALLGRRS
jgi:hypothetical protein